MVIAIPRRGLISRDYEYHHPINKTHWHRQEERVEAVEHTAMAWHDVTGIFHPVRTLEHRLYQVAEGACHNNDEGKTYPYQYIVGMQKASLKIRNKRQSHS